ncbi:ComEA family DNA-binding protein [Arthrobacter sp. MYb227]|uniref:ComEA family DNA-binding protein n=1 Tax=Arthrobacter sp. MYb227 TaxID=1848601 RepID=UPI001C6168F7|nr:ComEA family DNA-binding protein [Arthrobacter sp. MYb227]
MGRHDWANDEAPSIPAPVPGRLRVLIGRSAVIVLVIGILSWISISLLFNPPPDGPLEVQSVELSSAPAAPQGKGSPDSFTDKPAATGTTQLNTEPSGSSASGPTDKLILHVIGAVKTPGVYELEPGSRVRDAVSSAGGLNSNAAPENINLAAQVTDGQQVRIPKRGENPLPAAAVPDPPASETTPASDASTQGQPDASGSKININTADSTALQVLPGIGPALAQRIIDFRQSNGAFTSVVELDAVSGIGPALLGKIRDRVEFK